MSRWLMPLALLVLLSPARPNTADIVSPNDNTRSAGTLANGVLTIALEARTGAWRPEGDGGRSIDVGAFAEEGKALSTPGPVIRVPVGTVVRATIRNRLDRPLVVAG